MSFVIDEELSQLAQQEYMRRVSELIATGEKLDVKVEAKLFAQSVERQILKNNENVNFSTLEKTGISVTKDDCYRVAGFVIVNDSYNNPKQLYYTITVCKEKDIWKVVKERNEKKISFSWMEYVGVSLIILGVILDFISIISMATNNYASISFLLIVGMISFIVGILLLLARRFL